VTEGHTDRGKWSQPGVPHKGWSCAGIEDLEERSQPCEMCESVEIRYVHLMEHPDYPEIIGVGCICAEHMEEDYVGPRLREKKMRSRTRRRKTWAKRNWSTSARGNWYLNTHGFNVVVFETADKRWGLRVTHRASGRGQFGRRRYETEARAKHAALDALIWAEQHLGVPGPDKTRND
jgi:hypothetical protein